MKITVTYKTEFGRKRFYPKDTWSKDFLSIISPPSNKMKSFTDWQIKKLQELGFKIFIEADCDIKSEIEKA